MNNELVFRIIFWFFLSVIIIFNRIIPLMYSKKNNEQLIPDKAAVKNEGKPTFILRIIFGLVFFGILLAYSLYPSFMSILHLDYSLWIRWLGVLISIVGTVFWIYSQIVLGRYWSPQLQIQNEHKIISEGPYKYIRHPIYTAMMVWVIGLVLFTANILFVILALTFFIFFVARVPKEEKMMIETFGDIYTKYMKDTGRYLPKIKRNA
jgi:protein-S-isoprenylcysteine O-methyltransferase Ste14